MKTIAKKIISEYGISLEDLRRKQYRDKNLLAAKMEFIRRCKIHYSTPEIADFMDYNITTVSKLYSKAMEGKPKFKYEKLLQMLKQRAVGSDEFDYIKAHISRLRGKGYNIYKDGDKYRLA